MAAHLAASNFAKDAQFADRVVTRAEYQESGSNACRKKFARAALGGAEDSPEETREAEREQDRSKQKGKARGKGAVADGGKRIGRARARTATK